MTKLHTTIVFIPLTLRDGNQKQEQSRSDQEWFNVHSIISYGDQYVICQGAFPFHYVEESANQITKLLKGILNKGK